MTKSPELAITLYTNPQSRARIVRWMLEETELPYRAEVIDYGPSMKSPAFLARNPMGKVPTLTHGNTVITEVAAICTYLADLVPEKKLAPCIHETERATYLRWLFFIAGPLESIMTAKQTGHFAEPQTAGYGRYTDVLNTLEHAIGGKTFLCGNTFTAADLLMVANLRWYMGVNLLDPRDSFKEFVLLHQDRPAAKRAFELDGPISMPSNEP